MTIRLLTARREFLRDVDYPGDKPPNQIVSGGATFYAVGNNPKSNLHEYVCLRTEVTA